MIPTFHRSYSAILFYHYLFFTLIEIFIHNIKSIMKVTILLCFLAFTLLANARHHISQNDDDKVKVDFYYESLCPYCQQFIQKSLKIAASTKDFWKICDFSLYPYGNARRSRNGTSWTFTCQHGVRQCEGNLIETCAIKKFDFYSQALPFIICLEAESSNWTQTGQKCASQLNMNWDEISGCAKSEQGIHFEAQMADVTERLEPPHTYVPWVVINDKHSSSSESNLLTNMVKYVCSIYKGPIKIDACN